MKSIKRRHAWVKWVGVCLAMSASKTTLAQSNLTIYGLIDTGIQHVTNIGPARASATLMPTLTGSLPSRWGLRGREDLGGGLSAITVLESGFDPGTGGSNQSGRLFGRQAYVGLSGSWGTLTFGRQYSQIFWGLIGDTLAPNIYGAGLLDPYLVTPPRTDNSIVYSYKTGGLSLGLGYSLGRDAVAPAIIGGCAGESATDWHACKSVSGMLKYETPRWGAAVAFDRNYGGGGTPSSLPTSSLTDTRAVINGYVKFHTVTLGAGFQRRINHGIQAPGVSNVSSDYSWLGAQYLLHPQVMLDAQVGHLDVQDRPLGGSVIAARAMYLLSKRTAVYVTAGRVFNERNANFTVDGGTANTSSLPLAGVNQTGVMVGVRHSF